MANRLEGQIWIDRKAPYNLKYFVNGKEYAIDTSVIYSKSHVATDCYKGTLVAVELNAENAESILVPAEFPTNYNSIIGICTEDILKDKDNPDATIINEGYINVPISSIEGITENNVSSLVGKEVYWNLKWKADTSSSKTNLTISTPDAAIEYYNLPMVGAVTKVDGNEVEIHLNFSNFSDKISWKKEIKIVIKNDSVEKSADTIEREIDTHLLKGNNFSSDVEVFIDNSPIICKTFVEGELVKIYLNNIFKDLTLAPEDSAELNLTVFGTLNVKG
jgi:hypothetical protein